MDTYYNTLQDIHFHMIVYSKQHVCFSIDWLLRNIIYYLIKMPLWL